MSRSHHIFPSGRQLLAGTLDGGSASSGLLIVGGGREARSGAFSGQAQLAARIAAQGFPVFRFDQRGIGDSSGEYRGFRESGEDIIAAIAAFRDLCPQMSRLIAFGNCDAASALMMLRCDGCNALVLSNPWTFEQDVDDAASLPPREAIRSRYLAKFRNPGELLRLLRGEINFTKLAKGLKASVVKPPKAGSLAQEMAAGLAGPKVPYIILLAENDRTAQVFAAGWDDTNGEIRRCRGASHGYVEPHARAWLETQILSMLAD